MSRDMFGEGNYQKLPQGNPKGPFRTKIVRRANSLRREKFWYGSRKTLRRVLRSACFSRKERQENSTDSKKTMAVAKYYGFGRRTIFSTEGSFGIVNPVFSEGHQDVSQSALGRRLDRA